MTEYIHTPAMGEISGFGGSYEAGCQTMLDAGVKWLEEHKDADLQAHSYENVFGIIIPDSDDAKELERVIVAAADEKYPDGGVTGAMLHAVMSRLFYIARKGWDDYCLQCAKRGDDGKEATTQ